MRITRWLSHAPASGAYSAWSWKKWLPVLIADVALEVALVKRTGGPEGRKLGGADELLAEAAAAVLAGLLAPGQVAVPHRR